MELKTFKPTTPSRRGTVLLGTRHLTKKKAEKKLTKRIKYNAARNSQGRITMRHKGGRAKRIYRIIDFSRSKKNVKSSVISLEYDPFRTASIALLKFSDGDKRYILAPQGLKIGMEVIAGEDAPIKVGNSLPLKKIPSGVKVHCIQLNERGTGQLCRASGSSAQVMGSDKGYTQLKMPSGEIRLISEKNYATIGEVGNIERSNVKLGKAGRSRHLGIRPSVRGQVMGGHEHPHGGGESKHRVGGQRKDVYGHRTDRKTRRNKRTNRLIIKRRK